MNYHLVFSGEIKEGLDPDEVKQAFALDFGVSEQQMQQLFSGETHLIKKNLTEQQILKYILKLDDIGLISYVDSPESELQLPEDVTEDRRIRDRRIKFDRRKITRCNIIPDRRRDKRRENE